MCRRTFLSLACLLLVLAAAGGAAAGPAGPIAGNPADRLLSVPIDEARYDHATACQRGASRGALALQAWLGRNARGSSWGIMRCQRLSGRHFSLHAEGRAIDWHLDARRARDRRAASRLAALLLAPDRAGNEHALARRMGIQEIIWNCRSWWSGSPGMDRYSACFRRSGRPRKVDRTTAHRDHMHIGLNKRGARMLTSFWRRGR